MRKIGSISSEAQARRFNAYLVSIGVPAQTDQSRDGTWEIWVHNDAQLQQGTTELEQFTSNPADERYTLGARNAAKMEQQQRAEEKRSRTKIIDARSHWGVFYNQAMGPVTLGLMFVCVALFVYERVSGSAPVQDALMFTSMTSLKHGDPWWAIKHGQVWRLLTPALLHGGLLHILFNMMWLRQLGSAIENIEGSVTFGVQVFVFALVSNVAQAIIGGPMFLGMSGVVYGLFGYTWICAKHDPKRAYVLDRETVILMIIWFVLCFTEALGPIANWAHAGGLIAGILWATVTVRQIPFTKIRF